VLRRQKTTRNTTCQPLLQNKCMFVTIW